MKNEKQAAASMAYAAKMNKACRNLEGAELCKAVNEANSELSLARALAFMNELMAGTNDGLTVEEFPEACYRASAKFGVKYEELADAYDEQYAEQDAKDWAESCAQMKQAEGIWEDNGCYWPASGA